MSRGYSDARGTCNKDDCQCMGKEFFMELAMVAAYRAVHGGHKTWETFFMEDDNKPKPPRYFQEIMKEEQITMAEPVV